MVSLAVLHREPFVGDFVQVPHVDLVYDSGGGRIELDRRNLWPQVFVFQFLQFIPGDAAFSIGSLDLEMAAPPPRGLHFENLHLEFHCKEHDRHDAFEAEEIVEGSISFPLTPCVRRSEVQGQEGLTAISLKSHATLEKRSAGINTS